MFDKIKDLNIKACSDTEHNENINLALKDHQLKADWDYNKLICDLHTWTERFHFEFKLKFDEVPAIMIDKIGHSTYGHFKPGRNGFGLRNEVAINETFLSECDYWQTLGTLLHELLHVEQEQSGHPGKNNYHNKAFRNRAESLGLIVDNWGHTQYAPVPTPFFNVLKKYGVNTPRLPELTNVEVTQKPGNSKLKLWICDCLPQPVHVRVAIKDFQARCLKCGHNFKQEQ